MPSDEEEPLLHTLELIPSKPDTGERAILITYHLSQNHSQVLGGLLERGDQLTIMEYGRVTPSSILS